jgi:hypothetical protein
MIVICLLLSKAEAHVFIATFNKLMHIPVKMRFIESRYTLFNIIIIPKKIDMTIIPRTVALPIPIFLITQGAGRLKLVAPIGKHNNKYPNCSSLKPNLLLITGIKVVQVPNKRPSNIKAEPVARE